MTEHLVPADAREISGRPTSDAWNLVWVADPEFVWETEWVGELLAGIRANHSVNPRLSEVSGRSVIVFSENGRDASHSATVGACIKRLARAGDLRGLIHLSDEWYGAPLTHYADAPFVIRVGHWSAWLDPKILTVPIGLSSAFVRSAGAADSRPVKPAGERRFCWSFLGQLHSKPTRSAMIGAFASIPKGYIFETFRWNDPCRLTDANYREILSESVFSLCPRGWSTEGNQTVDSFRTYESADSGAIPLVDSAYYADAFGAPFPILRPDWNDGPELVRGLCADPSALHALQTRCHEWWRRYRRECAAAVRDHICRFTV